jgi:hypothetical protein
MSNSNEYATQLSDLATVHRFSRQQVVDNEFNRFQVFHWSHESDELLAGIYCYLDSDFVGRILFHADDVTPAPQNRVNEHGGVFGAATSAQPDVYFPISRFQDLMLLLGEQGPMHLFLNTQNLIGVVSSDPLEPIAE